MRCSKKPAASTRTCPRASRGTASASDVRRSFWPATGDSTRRKARRPPRGRASGAWPCRRRSEEHTSELQSRQYLVCRLLLEKKKRKTVRNHVDADNGHPTS